MGDIRQPRHQTVQGEPLRSSYGPMNGRKSIGSWGCNPYKWSYNLINRWGPTLHYLTQTLIERNHEIYILHIMSRFIGFEMVSETSKGKHGLPETKSGIQITPEKMESDGILKETIHLPGVNFEELLVLGSVISVVGSNICHFHPYLGK